MKHMVALALLLLAVTHLFAQEYYLVNETDSILYVRESVPADLAPSPDYRQIPVGGVLPVSGDEAVGGFAFQRGLFQLPTFGLSAAELETHGVRSEGGRTYVALTTEMLTEERVASTSDFASVFAGPRLDNRYLEWISREARVARGRGRAPLGVFADFGEGRERIDVEQSLLWQRGGTDLQWLKTARSAHDLFLAASSYTSFARGTGLFLYLYRESEDAPVATLELPVGGGAQGARDGEPGFVLLWLRARSQPLVVGNFVAGEFFLEAQLWTRVLDDAIPVDLNGLVVEVSTASSAAGVWEEFVLVREHFGVLFPE